MKSFFLIISCFLFQPGFTQVALNIQWTKQSSLPANTTIYYEAGQKLGWDDFEGPEKDEGIVAAVTYSGFGYKADIRTVGNKSDLNIKVYCYFDKDKSWVKQSKASDYILRHEQHHFDISYIVTCIFIDRIQSTVFTTGNINQVLSKIYNECLEVMNKMQDEYDAQTNNGRLKDKQEEWNKKIASMLKQFSHPIRI